MTRRFAAALLLSTGLATISVGVANAQPDLFNQDTFPCQEDEVLGYAPQFGPDRVGCIHIDDLR